MTTRTLQNLINGEYVDSADGRTSGIVNPSTEEEFATAPISGAEDVDRAMAAAATAFETWRDTTPSERQRALLKFADAMEERAEELVAAESREHRQAARSSPAARSCHRRSTRSASSRARRGCWRDARPASTWPATRPTSGASRSASWPR